MSLPFKNLKFCSTSVPSDIRLEIVSKIKAMGGEHFSHLMSDVDVLIVGDRDTDKYKYSVKHRLDIKFVRPRAIYTLYDNWVKGGAEPQTSIDTCLMPVFDALNICISRMTNVNEKQNVILLIKHHNGALTDSLTINNTCVIASEKSGKRYAKALEWGIPVVHPQWITDSVKRGAALEYEQYEISKVLLQDIGIDSCMCWDSLLLLLLLQNSLKRPMLEDAEKTVKAAKRENHLWNNIMGNIKPPSMGLLRNTAWDDNQDHDTELMQEERSKFPIKRVNNNNNDNELFAGFQFGLYGFDDPLHLKKLTKVIRSHKGDLIDDLKNGDISRITHLLIPSTKTLDDIEPLMKESIDKFGFKLVTEWFIERCLHYNEIKLDKWGTPFHHGNLNLNLKISISGFTGIELLHAIKLIKFLGCEYCDTLTANRDLLVINLAIIGLNKENSASLFSYKYPELITCSDSNKAGIVSTKNKINACKKWNIPIVSMAYLMEAIDQGSLPELLHHKWCIFAPKQMAKKPQTLMEYVRNNNNNNNNNDNNSDTESLTLPKLPSPLKKKKKNWGRLIGRAQETQMSNNFSLQDEVQSEVAEDEPPSTQISYNDNEGDKDPSSRRKTRKHLKELQHEL